MSEMTTKDENHFCDFTISESKTPNGAFIDTRVIARCFDNGEVNLISTSFGCGFGGEAKDSIVRLDDKAIDKLLMLIWNDPAREKTNSELLAENISLKAKLGASPAGESS